MTKQPETFDEVVDFVSGEGGYITERGMAVVYSLLGHIAAGGGIDNHPVIPSEMGVIMLAQIWIDLERSKVAR